MKLPALLGALLLAATSAGAAPAAATIDEPPARLDSDGPSPDVAKTEPDAGDEAPEAGDEAPSPAPAAPGEEADPPEPNAPPRARESAVAGPRAIDKVLPSGVRVIVANDSTLPVASVVLAIEGGGEDDPKGIPGLHHALAYQLLQGNRDTAPGGIARLVHDGGGVTSLATGPAQIRFESVVPVSTLAELVTAEAHRLRAPTVVDALWRDTLIWARRDPARSWGAPLPALAAVHGVAGLGRNNRQVSAELTKLEPRAVAAALADRFRYERTTLVVVGPHPPQATLALADALFSDLPPRTRAVPSRSMAKPSGDAPRPLPVKGSDGTAFVWPVAPNPAAIAWAKVWCRTLNRQRRDKAEDRRARVRCRLDEDPRRAVMTLRATGGADPWALLQGRVERIASGSEDRLVQTQLKLVRQDLEFELRTPLGLARMLARSSATAAATDPDAHERPIRVLTGMHALSEPSRFPSIHDTLPPGAAVQLVGLAQE